MNFRIEAIELLGKAGTIEKTSSACQQFDSQRQAARARGRRAYRVACALVEAFGSSCVSKVARASGPDNVAATFKPR